MTKKIYKRYKMHQEILSQPAVLNKIISDRIRGKKNKIFFSEMVHKIEELKNISRFIFLGCGTSYNACLLGNLVFEEITKLNCETEYADEFNRRNPVIEANTAIIAISQSGETKETISAIKLAKQKKVLIISMTNNKTSRLAKLADANIYIEAGEEKAVAATKTFSAQALSLILLALFINQEKNDKTDKKLIGEIKQLPGRAKKIIAKEEEIKRIALEFVNIKDVAILGGKFNYPIALEAALKLKETANIFAEGTTVEEFEHGPKSLINENFPCFIIAPEDSVFSKNKKTINSLFNLGAKILLITSNHQLLNNKKAIKFRILKYAEILTPIVSIIPMQLLAYHLALAKGMNIDRPRNIKKFIK